MASDYSTGNDDTFLPPSSSSVSMDASAPPAGGGAATPTSANQVAQWYRQILGRAPESTAVVDTWAGQDPATAQAGIQNSAEAQAYAAANPGTARTVSPIAGGATTPQAGAGAAGGTAASGLTTPSFSTAAPAPTIPSNPQYADFITALLGKANASPNVDPNDPQVQAATDAYSADQTRAGRNFLTAAAEKSGPYGDIGAETGHAAEVTGQQTAAYRANLVNTLTQQRMQAIQTALTTAGSTLTAQDQARLQEEYLQLQQQQFGANTTQQAWQDQYNTVFG